MKKKLLAMLLSLVLVFALGALASAAEVKSVENSKAAISNDLKLSDLTPLRAATFATLDTSQMNVLRNSTVFVDNNKGIAMRTAGVSPKNPNIWVDSVGYFPDYRSLATDTAGVLYVVIRERKGPAEERKFILKNFTLKDKSVATVGVVRTTPAMTENWMENGVKVGTICYWNTGYYYNPNIMAELYFTLDTWWGERWGSTPWQPIMIGGRIYMQ